MIDSNGIMRFQDALSIGEWACESLPLTRWPETYSLQGSVLPLDDFGMCAEGGDRTLILTMSFSVLGFSGTAYPSASSKNLNLNGVPALCPNELQGHVRPSVDSNHLPPGEIREFCELDLQLVLNTPASDAGEFAGRNGPGWTPFPPDDDSSLFSLRRRCRQVREQQPSAA